MGIVDTISTVAQLPTLLKLKKGMQPRAIDEKDCLGAQVEKMRDSLDNQRPSFLKGSN